MSAQDDDMAEFDMSAEEFDALLERGEPATLTPTPGGTAPRGLNRHLARRAANGHFVNSERANSANRVIATVTPVAG